MESLVGVRSVQAVPTEEDWVEVMAVVVSLTAYLLADYFLGKYLLSAAALQQELHEASLPLACLPPQT